MVVAEKEIKVCEETPVIDEESKWVWVDGYKATNSNMVCHFQFFLIILLNIQENYLFVVLDYFCPELEDVFNYYAFDFKNRFLK